MSDPWRAWSELASAPWRHRLELPGARLLSELSGLDQRGEVWTWTEDRVWRVEGGPWVLVRAARSSDDPAERLLVLSAASADELVRRVEASLGRTPGMIELLGRAGIELGLAPDDVIEGDDIDDWPAGPPPGR